MLGNTILTLQIKLGIHLGGIVVNREDILKKARQENKDEMAEQVRDRSMRWTYIVMVLTAAVFAFLRAERGETLMDLSVTVCASVAAGQLYRFLKTRERPCLVLGLIALAVSILALVRFCMGY